MAFLDQSIKKTLIHEGGFNNDPNDAGGATKFGITQRDLPDTDIQDLTEDQAIDYYQEHYVKPLFSEIGSQALCDKLFDMGVLFGVGTATKILQQTLDITQDGVFGPNTLAVVNQADESSTLENYKTNLVSHAFNIATANPQDREFLKGWTNRINS